MDAFDLARLTDVDFEHVMHDLFQDMLGVQLELFGPGRDKGIDLRHISGPDSLIIQCKHWMRSGRASLLRHLRNVEAPKVRALKPTRYILVASVDLTPSAKDRLTHDLDPYLRTPGDAYGLSELQELLRQRPQLVQRHLRLWLSSTTVLSTVLNSAIITRSSVFSSDIETTLRTFVTNPSYGRAHQLLEQQRVCIIAGMPGIGKTTLAQVLAATYMAQGFQLIVLSSDAGEADQLWQPDVPQLFVYDDFLGQNALDDKLNKNEDQRLLSLLRRANRSPNKRFLLTTREYILESAKPNYEQLARFGFDPLTCVIDLADYTRLIRATMLYYHLHFADINARTKWFFSQPRAYRPLIDHPNFNPRLIAYGVEMAGRENLTGAEASSRIRLALDDPRDLWEHVIQYQLPDHAVNLLVVMLSLAPRASHAHLSVAWRRYQRQVGGRSEHRELDDAFRALDGSMLRSTADAGTIVWELHNPSIRDYLTDYLAAQPEVVQRLLCSAEFFEQVETIWRAADRSRSTRGLWRWPELIRLSNARADSLLAALSRDCENLEQSYTRCFDKPAVQRSTRGPFPPDLVARLTTGVSMCERIAVPCIIEFVTDHLKVEFLLETDGSGETLAELAKAVANSRVTALSDRADAVVEAAVEWVNQDLSDWDNLQYAESVLESLGNLAPERVLESIQDSMFDYAREHVEWWASDQVIPRWHQRQAEEILEFVGEPQFDLDPDLSAQLASVRAQVESFQMPDKPRVNVPESASVEDMDQDEGAIREMFASLRRVRGT